MKSTRLALLLTLLFTPLALAELRIGVSIAQVDDVFLARLRDNMAAHAKQLPGVTLQFEDAQGDVVRQLNQVQNFTSQGLDAIIVNPVDTAATGKISEAALKSGIALVFVNRRPDNVSFPAGVAYIGSDEITAGEIQMSYLAEKMGGKGNLAIMLSLLSNNATHNRTKGVKRVLKRYPDIHVVEEQSAEWQRGKAMDLMHNWILSGKKIDAVAANADEMAIGAAMAIAQAGMRPGHDILVGGTDGGPAGLDAIGKGQLLVTVYQNNQGQAQGAVDLALKMIHKQPYTSEVNIPFELVTKDNYQRFVDP